MLFLKVWQCTYNFLRDLLELGCDLSHDLLQQVNIVNTTTFPYDYWQVVWRILSSTTTTTWLLRPESYCYWTFASWTLPLLDFCVLNLTTTGLLHPEPYHYCTWLLRPEPYYYLTSASWTLLLLDFCVLNLTNAVSLRLNLTTAGLLRPEPYYY